MTASSRDPRLIAVHRGGLLSATDHRLLAAWAAGCAERVLPLFEGQREHDERPRNAIAEASAWAAGTATTGEARSAAVLAHAAAREATGAAVPAARAAGHAAATAHMADHELGAAYYALLALQVSGASADEVEAERRWQLASVPAAVAELVRWDMAQRSQKFRGLLG